MQIAQCLGQRRQGPARNKGRCCSREDQDVRSTRTCTCSSVVLHTQACSRSGTQRILTSRRGTLILSGTVNYHTAIEGRMHRSCQESTIAERQVDAERRPGWGFLGCPPCKSTRLTRLDVKLANQSPKKHETQKPLPSFRPCQRRRFGTKWIKKHGSTGLSVTRPSCHSCLKRPPFALLFSGGCMDGTSTCMQKKLRSGAAVQTGVARLPSIAPFPSSSLVCDSARFQASFGRAGCVQAGGGSRGLNKWKAEYGGRRGRQKRTIKSVL